ncbi:MAG: haloalkane dehalogenase [Nannocystales bacterium]
MHHKHHVWALAALLLAPGLGCASDDADPSLDPETSSNPTGATTTTGDESSDSGSSEASAGTTAAEATDTGDETGDPATGTDGGGDGISADFPFESHFVDVLGSSMHYVDEGSGPPVLLLHGQPTSAYLWRNVIPHLTSSHRVIAVDLIGFGESGKPDIDYRVADHAQYLEAFIQALEIGDDLALVVHDWGSFLGFDYAMQHPEQIRGIAFMESMLRPIPGYDFWDEQTAMFMQAVRTEGVGEPMILEDNLFIEAMIPSMVLRDLTPEEHDRYREPFLDPQTRGPMLVFPRELPVGGEPADVHARQVAYLDALQTSQIPKLHVHVEPGVVNTAEDVSWAQDNLPNLTSVGVGAGLHYLQEDHPHEIGQAIADWLNAL